MDRSKVVLITGASSGIGKETAFALLKGGFTVYTAARRVDRMDDLKKEGAIPIKMDVTVEEDLLAAIDQIGRDHDGVDILINNAGYGSYGAMEDTTLEDARYQFEVNMFGAARLTQLVLPHMRKKRWGKIVNVSSMGGKVYTPLGSWYHASKHALEGWSDCLRLELAQFGIDVIIIEPGAIKTQFGNVMVKPMMERSGDTAYADLANKMKRATEASDGNGASPPSVVVDAIVESVTARRPKTRYLVGKWAKQTIFVRKWFGDRAFDKFIVRLV